MKKKTIVFYLLAFLFLFSINVNAEEDYQSTQNTDKQVTNISEDNLENITNDTPITPINEKDDNSSSGDDLDSLYKYGIEKGIIDPEKYPFESFLQNDKDHFKNLFNEYNSITGIEKITYKEWLVLNNYGLMADTQESLLDLKIQPRDTASNKRKFCATAKKGDILISSGNSVKGLVGHSAIMTTDNWVLEMPGGSPSKWTNNNRQITKDKWFDQHAKDWNTIYRCKNSNIASKAANWADKNYYNPNGGTTKTIKIDYGITYNFTSKNPSYCSKLVTQAFWYGSGNAPVMYNIANYSLIIPTQIPELFTKDYALQYKGKY